MPEELCVRHDPFPSFLNSLFLPKTRQAVKKSRGRVMPGRNSQVSRIYAILNLLEGNTHGLSVSEITSRMKERGHGASTRTIYRDLEALNSAGFPLFPKKDEGGDDSATRWTLERTARINQYLVLSPRELVALYLAQQVLTPLKNTPFYQDLEQLFSKIEEKLGSKSKEHLRELSGDIHFEPGPIWGLGVDPGILDTVTAACAEGQLFACVYASVNTRSKKRRVLGPHYLYFAKGSLYLVAEEIETKVVKTFSLPRMTEAEMLDEAYLGEKSDPEEHFKDSFGIFRGENPVEVRLAFDKELASFVKERSWHPSQQITSKADGTLEVRLHVALTPELQQWVLVFGAQVSVLAPLVLRDQILAEAGKILGIYRGSVDAA